MEIITNLINFILHFDKHLGSLIQTYDSWTYLILFLIVFCETGLVVAPFLPGDSLLFTAGAFAGVGLLNIGLLFFLLFLAAVLGDNTNYAIGNLLSRRVLSQKKIPFIKEKHLDRTHEFYEIYGTRAIILARFIPIIRTFAPFVAGVGTMRYRQFLPYDVLGGFAWIGFFTLIGYFFGNLSVVKENFSLAIVAIVGISIIPIIIEYLKHKRNRSN